MAKLLILLFICPAKSLGELCASVPSTALPWSTEANPTRPLYCWGCSEPVAIPLSGAGSSLTIFNTGGSWGDYGGALNNFPLATVTTAPGAAPNCPPPSDGYNAYPCAFMEEQEVCPPEAPAGACCSWDCYNDIYPGMPFVWAFADAAGALLAPPRFGPIFAPAQPPAGATQVLLGVNDIQMTDNAGAITVCLEEVPAPEEPSDQSDWDFRVSEVLGYDTATPYAPGAPFSCSFAAPDTAALPLNISLRPYFNATGYTVDPSSGGGVVAASWLVWELNGALEVPSLPTNISIGYYGAPPRASSSSPLIVCTLSLTPPPPPFLPLLHFSAP